MALFLIPILILWVVILVEKKSTSTIIASGVLAGFLVYEIAHLLN